MNYDNTCYLNSVLQALLHLKYTICNAPVESISSLYNSLSDSSDSVQSTHRDFVGGVVEKFRYTGQQDAQEFLLDFLNAVDKESAVNMSALGIMKDIPEQEDAIKEILRKSIISFREQAYPHNMVSNVTANFTGQLHTKMMCEKCHYTDHSFEIFNTLSLDITDAQSAPINNLLTAIENYEKVDSIERLCKCGHTTSLKKTMVFIPSDYLIIHLKRFTGTGHVQRHSVFIPPVMSVKTSNPLYQSYNYKLSSIVHHVGSETHGHYFTTLHSAQSDHIQSAQEVIVCDDHNINTAKITNYPFAYLVFYVKV